MENWEKQIYSALLSLEEELFVIGETVYKSFWNGMFGPSLAPLQVEILVPEEKKILLIQKKLSSILPKVRWALKPLDSGIKDWQDSKTIPALAGSVHIHQNQLSYIGKEEIYEQLKTGMLIPREPLDERLIKEICDLLSWYPGLKCPAVSFESANVFQEWDDMLADIHEMEKGGRVNHDTLSLKQTELNEEIRRWHESASKLSECMPIPAPSALPADDPWQAPDEEFREWVLSQTLLRDERIPEDDYLQESLIQQRGAEQKATHQGSELYQHAIYAMLTLDTNNLPSKYRRTLRVAMLEHDAGKDTNIWTPGAHGAIGAKKWKGPDWMSPEEKKLVRFLIKYHDSFGLMDRWLRDPGYKGGLSPKSIVSAIEKEGYEVKEILPLMIEVYKADIGSVSSLRWLLPLTPMLEKMVMLESSCVKTVG